MAAYTSGDWQVKPGREKEFVEAWRELATWVGAEYDPGGWAKLLHDKDDPYHFRSVGEWSDLEAVTRWQGSDGFKQRMATMRELLDDMRIYSLSVAAEVQA